MEWQTHRHICAFPLGTHDLPDRLLIPERLYGREREVNILLGAYERMVTHGNTELVLVSGYSGIGKSSVVNELHRVRQSLLRHPIHLGACRGGAHRVRSKQGGLDLGPGAHSGQRFHRQRGRSHGRQIDAIVPGLELQGLNDARSIGGIALGEQRESMWSLTDPAPLCELAPLRFGIQLHCETAHEIFDTGGM
jgi:hypothetical protein